jgi:dethiobiotin synthetase/adenosylmethionine--8-amino-7-oxononanoate aminotransferase
MQAEALLHGHSYTAYPVGCAAALASLAVLQDAGLNPNVCTPRQPGRCRKAGPAACAEPCGQLLPMWDEAAAADLSRHSRVAGVVVLGSVLAVELADAASAETRGGRYGSAAAAHVVAGLRERGIAARPLGPVVYLMAAPTSSRQRCQWLTQQLGKVLARCEDEGGWGDADGVLI